MSKLICYIVFSVTSCLFLLPAKSRTVAGIEMPGVEPAFQPAVSHPRKYAVFVNPVVPTSRYNREILNYINEMRRDPKTFYRKYLENYIKEKSNRFTATYTHSLKKAMLQAPALPVFQADPVLKKTASLQLDYLARFGRRKLTHEQGNVSFAERMKRSGLHCLAENLYTGDDPKALEVVLDLLIDQNVPSFGHRKNLMNPMYTHIGIVHTTPPGGRTLVVMDFGCKS